MTLQETVTFKTPVVRVLDRDANITFYQKVLGFKLISEENAVAIFSTENNPKRRFVIEESPTYRTRAVQGPRKLHKTIIKIQEASEIESLLASGISVDQIFKGENGYAFEATSPEGYTYLLHAEEDRTRLQKIDAADFTLQADFKGLSDFTIETIILNVPDLAVAQAFYHKLNLPIEMEFQQAQGVDLLSDPDTVWDLEFLEFEVSPEVGMSVVKTDLANLGCEIIFEDKKLLVIKDTSNIEIWFSKA